MSTFKKGDLVICVGDSPGTRNTIADSSIWRTRITLDSRIYEIEEDSQGDAFLIGDNGFHWNMSSYGAHFQKVESLYVTAATTPQDYMPL